MYTNHQGFTLILAVAILLTAFAGCLGNDSSDLNTQDGKTEEHEPNHFNSSEPAPEPEPTQETGSINGQVVDDSFTPIQGGLVSLTNNTGTVTETFTDSDGKYTINDIKPGEYGLRFTAECCEEHLERIRIQADRTTTTSPILAAWGGHEPHVQEYDWTGYICAEGPPFMDQCKSADDNHNTQYNFEVDRGIKSLLIAMQFEDGFNYKECLDLRLRVPAFEHDDYNSQTLVNTGCETSPIEFRLDAGTMRDHRDRPIEQHDFENITDWMPLQYRISGDSWGYSPLNNPIPDMINVVVAQTFTIYWKEYYWEHAPQGASALPDH